MATATPPVRTAYYAIWWIRWPSVHSPDLARSTSRWRYHRRLKPGQHRAPAHPVRLEFRIVCDKTNRRALNHPNTPGLSPDLVSAAIQAAHRITDRWNEQLIRQDHALEWTSDQTGRPAVYNNVPAEPYGEPTHTAVAHPVQFSDYNLNLATRAAVAHALQLATPYTVVESPQYLLHPRGHLHHRRDRLRHPGSSRLSRQLRLRRGRPPRPTCIPSYGP